MIRSLLFFAPCAVAGYLYYPQLSAATAKMQQPEEQKKEQVIPGVALLDSVNLDEVVGSWALTPRSMGLVSDSLGTSGKRGSLSLESWGGGEANLALGQTTIRGPVAWSIRPGTPTTLVLSNNKREYHLQFSRLNGQLVIGMEAVTADPSKSGYLRFLKTS